MNRLTKLKVVWEMNKQILTDYRSHKLPLARGLGSG